jgi:hypothetical protein
MCARRPGRQEILLLDELFANQQKIVIRLRHRKLKLLKPQLRLSEIERICGACVERSFDRSRSTPVRRAPASHPIDASGGGKPTKNLSTAAGSLAGAVDTRVIACYLVIAR